jgi:hypothetical protein
MFRQSQSNLDVAGADINLALSFDDDLELSVQTWRIVLRWTDPPLDATLLGRLHLRYKDVAMTRMLLLVLLGLGVCGAAGGSGPQKQQVHRDQLKEAADEVELGMPEQIALCKIGRPAETSGDGCSGPDWEWYTFAEWFTGGYRLEIRFRRGRVIKKLYHSYTE